MEQHFTDGERRMSNVLNLIFATRGVCSGDGECSGNVSLEEGIICVCGKPERHPATRFSQHFYADDVVELDDLVYTAQETSSVLKELFGELGYGDIMREAQKPGGTLEVFVNRTPVAYTVLTASVPRGDEEVADETAGLTVERSIISSCQTLLTRAADKSVKHTVWFYGVPAEYSDFTGLVRDLQAAGVEVVLDAPKADPYAPPFLYSVLSTPAN